MLAHTLWVEAVSLQLSLRALHDRWRFLMARAPTAPPAPASAPGARDDAWLVAYA